MHFNIAVVLRRPHDADGNSVAGFQNGAESGDQFGVRHHIGRRDRLIQVGDADGIGDAENAAVGHVVGFGGIIFDPERFQGVAAVQQTPNIP